MQKLLIVSLFTVFATKSLGQNSTIEDFFKTASTISDRFDTTNSTFRIRRIEVTPNSLSIDGKEMIQPSFQDFHLADSLIDKVFNLQLGDVIRFEKGTDIEYFKALKVDTSLYIRCATIGIPLKSETNIDSLYLVIKSQIEEGKVWNELKYHLTENENRIKGTTGWVPSSEIKDEFKNKFRRHQIGDIFIVKIAELNYGWIVYKTDEEKKFERKQVLYATNSIH